jgi:hypothetical protein
MIKNTVDFTVDCRGELTGNQYTGAFTAKTKLSLRESLRQDELYRGILGANSQDASLASKSIASAISYLSTHLMTWPDWWTNLNKGMDCEDVNLLAEINNTCQEKIDAEYKILQDEAKKAEDLLKAIPGA